MSTDIARRSAIHDKLKVAMAVAIAARKQDAQASSTDWKEKALRARSSLMKVSRTLKGCENGPEAAIRAVVDRIADFEHSTPQLQDTIGPSRDDVRDKSNQLLTFVEAVGALNAILDMRDGRLSRIWDTNPMIQLGNCLCDSLLGLPDSPMTEQALKSACLGVFHIARQGCRQEDINVLCDRLLQCALSASHPYIAVDVATRTVDGLEDRHNQKSDPNPRLPLVKATVSRLAQNPSIGVALLSQGSEILSWLLEVVANGFMPKSMHAAACSITVIEFMQDLAASVGLWLHTASQVERAQSSMESAVASLAGTKSKTEKLDQELVSHVIGSLIDLCKTSQDRLASVPGLRELMRQLLCTVTAALQAQVEQTRSHRTRAALSSMAMKHLAVCRDLLLQGLTVLQSNDALQGQHERPMEH